MNWARAKTLLIMLLFAVNLILGGLLLYRETQMRARESRAMEDLCALLEKNGLIAGPEQIPSALALTYDVERAPEGETDLVVMQTVQGLPVWGLTGGSGLMRLSVTPVSGYWLWGEALPISGKTGLSAGHCLLKLTDTWGETGVLESCELGFVAALIAPDVMRLRPCWRFVISGVEVFFPAA
ncbi:MAG: hypothetical protein LBI19_06610 [Oscillospiraceae bacterium]|jgi:hypothetical protein|nr:hypothetical protein [Oscillospiraceae bacterium]